MPRTVVTASPGFISIAVQDVDRSATFYERYLGAMRDTFDFGPDSAVFVGWPTFALSSARRLDLPGPSPETTSIHCGGGPATLRHSLTRWRRMG